MTDPHRRDFLERIGITLATVIGLAGCSSNESENPQTNTTSTGHTPPVISKASANPAKNGEAIQYQLIVKGEDLASVEITYGNITQKWESEELGSNVNKTGNLTDFSNPDEGKVVFLARNHQGEVSRESVLPDDQPPQVETFSIESTRNAGEMQLKAKGIDEVGLENLEISRDGQAIFEKSIQGKSKISIDRSLTLSDKSRMSTSTFTARLEDWNGNTATSSSEKYIRKYDQMIDHRLEIGATYILWAGDKFGKCLDVAKPSIGEYDYPMDPETTSKHIDQMQGFGVTNILINFNGTKNDREALLKFQNATLADQTKIRPLYTFKDYRWQPEKTNKSWKGDVLPDDMDFLREQVLSHDHALTYEDRPVFNIWNADYLPWSDAYHTKIIEEWGTYSDFIDDMRSLLQVDGNDPFIVGGVTGSAAHSGFENVKPRLGRFLKQLDATTSWVAGGAWGEDGQATWEEVISWLETTYQGHRDFAKSHDMEFIPMVFPGFDDRANTCWGEDRLTPRTQESFQQVLELADDYRTTKMVDIATWNDWTEGTQIEPGSFRNKDYGTDYLDILQEFQRDSP